MYDKRLCRWREGGGLSKNRVKEKKEQNIAHTKYRERDLPGKRVFFVEPQDGKIVSGQRRVTGQRNERMEKSQPKSKKGGPKRQTRRPDPLVVTAREKERGINQVG